MLNRASSFWTLCCVATLSASVIGVDSRVMFVETPSRGRVSRDVDKPDAGVSTTPTMTSWHVATEVLYRYAKTTLATRLVNPASVAKEITFSAVLPQAAFISAFHIEMDGKVYHAYVKEKEAAQQEYVAARAQGRTAATVVKARDSNVFTVSVNVEAEGKVTFNLTYEEMLTRRLGLYHHVISIDPGQVVPDLSLRVRIEDSLPLVNLSVPALRMSNEVDNTDETAATESGASGPTSITRPTPEVAVVEWTPSAEEQRGLRSEGLRTQLVVRYDVDRKNNPAQILLSDGYFVHFYAPTELTPLQKHAVFVLDISGSMSGRKMPQLKEAMATVLADLRQGDVFSLVVFSTDVKVWQPNGTLFEVRNYNNEISVPSESLVAVNTDNLERAQKFVAGLQPTASTNIHDALMIALDIVKIGRRSFRSSHPADNADNVPEPLIVFLTDGQANQGALTAPTDIVQAVTKKNERRTPIFCLAFGRGAELDFLKQLALANSAFAKLIYEAGDAALQLRDFYRQVSTPLLANVTFQYQPDKVDNTSLSGVHFNTLFEGSELVVAGRLIDSEQGATEAQDFGGHFWAKSSTGSRQFDFPKPTIVVCPTPTPTPTPTDARRPASFMERLWAHLTVQQLLDKERAAGDPKNSTGRTRALELALKYSFVTSLTSLVVVKPNATATSSDPVEAGADENQRHLHGARHKARTRVSSAVLLSQHNPYLRVPLSHNFAARPAMSSSSSSSHRGQMLISGGDDADIVLRSWQSSSRVSTPPSPRLKGPFPRTFPTTNVATHPTTSHTTTELSIQSSTPTSQTTSTTPAATERVQLTLADITWPARVRNDSHVFVQVGVAPTTAFQIGVGQVDANPEICPSGEIVSHCRHLANCVLPEFKDDFDKYVEKFFCAIGSFAGVCCPDSRHNAAILS